MNLSNVRWLCALTLAAMLAGCQGHQAPKPVAGPDRSKELSQTDLPAMNAKTAPLTQYVGKGGLLVVFVDTHCPFAEQTVGNMNTVSKTLDAYGVPAILVNLDDPKGEVDAFYQYRDIKVPVLFDVTTATKARWGITQVPTVVLLSPSAVQMYSGPAVWADVAKVAEGMLGLNDNTISFEPRGTSYG